MSTIGERLLNLAEEHRTSQENRRLFDSMEIPDSSPVGRNPDEIAAEYEAVLRELLQ